MFKKGDRVRYRKGHPQNGRVDYDGREGVVTHDSEDRIESRDSHTRVEWDNGLPWTPCNPFTLNLELVPMIDTTKPLEMYSTYAVNESVSPVTLIGKTDEGQIMIGFRGTVGTGADNRWYVFAADGSFVRSETGSGSALRLRNKVETETIHIRLSGIDRPPATSVHREIPQGHAVAAIEVTLTDGIVTGVSLARANREPILTDRVS